MDFMWHQVFAEWPTLPAAFLHINLLLSRMYLFLVTLFLL